MGVFSSSRGLPPPPLPTKVLKVNSLDAAFGQSHVDVSNQLRNSVGNKKIRASSRAAFDYDFTGLKLKLRAWLCHARSFSLHCCEKWIDAGKRGLSYIAVGLFLFFLSGNALAQTLTAVPTEIKFGEQVTLSYDVFWDRCDIYLVGADPLGYDWVKITSAKVSYAGEVTTTPPNFGDNIYRLACDFSTAGQTTVTTTEGGGDNPSVRIVSFAENPANTIMAVGESITLDWSVASATSCDASGDWEGSKSPTGGSEVITPASAGDKTYTLTCSDGTNESSKSVLVTFQPPPQITQFVATAENLEYGQTFNLSWQASNAATCTASGAWSGSKNRAGGTQNNIKPLPGTHIYTLTCRRGSVEDVQSVAVEATLSESYPIISSFAIDSVLANSVGYTDFIPLGKTLRVSYAYDPALVSGPSSNGRCEISWQGGSQTGASSGSANARITFDVLGEQEVMLTCEPKYGGETRRVVIPITVVPMPTIQQFSSTKNTVTAGEEFSLNWNVQDAETCQLNGEDVSATSGSKNITETIVGEYSYVLACMAKGSDKPTATNTVSQAQTVVANEIETSDLTGRYFGEYHFIMAQADSGTLPYVGWGAKTNRSGDLYRIMGWNYSPAYWMWDFDELVQTGTGKIYLGRSQLLALGQLTPPYSLFSPERERRDGQYIPDRPQPLDDEIGTFTDKGNGVYAVKFNLQIFVSIAGYPLGHLNNLMKVSTNGDGTLSISTLDTHPDGITYFDGWDSTVSAAGDGIPGSVLPKSTEINPLTGEKAYNGVFPERVSPGFHSFASMRKVDAGASCSGDGIPDTVKLQLRLDPCLADNDGDGISDADEIGPNWAHPLAEDDYIYDMLQPPQFDGKRNFAGQIALGNGERIVVHSDKPIVIPRTDQGTTWMAGPFYTPLNGEWLGKPNDFLVYPSNGGSPLPSVHPTNGKPLHYDLGVLHIYHRPGESEGIIRVYFANGVPEGLSLFALKWKREDGYSSVPFTALPDGKTIEFDGSKLPAPNAPALPIALAHTDADRVVATFDPTDSIYQAILTEAANSGPEPEPDPDPVIITSFVPASATITVGSNTNLLWQAQNASSCAIKLGDQLLDPALGASGTYEVTPASVGAHTYELTCVGAGDPASATTTVIVQTDSIPVDPNAITGVWTGNFSLTMRIAGSASPANPQGTVLGDSHNNYWIWNFDEGWAQFGRSDPGVCPAVKVGDDVSGCGQGMLSVGFPFHVQDLGNASLEHDRALFTRNEDGTYTLHHGYQIYNPGVMGGNPRTDMTTTFSIVRDGNTLVFTPLDLDGDGVPGLPVVGVFPLTVSAGINGVASQDGSLEPDPNDSGTDPGNTGLIGLFQATPGNVALGQPVTLTWQAVRATSCTASGDWSGAKATAGTQSVTPASERLHSYTLECTDGTETKRSTVTVQVGEGGSGGPVDPSDPSEPIDTGNGTANLNGIYLGEHMITMRGCPGTCVAGQEVVLGNEGEGDARLTATFTDNGDGTYTVQHGFQIYNPNVGSPRTDTHTVFRISRDPSNPNLLHIVTLDGESDGIAGTQIVGVFPMTVQPDFRGTARKEGSSSAGDGIADSVKEGLGLNPDAANADTDGDGIPDAEEIGPDVNNPLDSDGDGIIDALEPGDAAHDATRIGGLALLDGIPGGTQEGFAHAGSTVGVNAGNGWTFTGADTGLMQLAANEDNGGAIPDTTLGDAGLDYEHGYVQVQVSSSQRLPSFGAQAADTAYAAAAEPVGPVTLTFTFEAALPAADTLLVYATAMVEGKERYTLLDPSAWTRLDAHTLEVTVQDNGERDLDSASGQVRTGIAPTANTLGGYEESSGNASGGGGGGSTGGLLLMLALLALAGMQRRRALMLRHSHTLH